MTEVVFGPVKSPTTDWRWQEVLNLEPYLVMAELRELDENLFAARSELREAVRDLAALEDTLHASKQQALEDVMGTDDQELADKLFKGGTKGERAQRQETYLVALDWVSESMREIEVASMRKDNAQVAFDSLLDRQTNLGRFANMYAATARLLASIRPPEELIEATLPSAPFEATLYFVAVGKPGLRVPCFGSEDIVAAQREAKGRGYQEVSAAVYELRAAWDEQLAEVGHKLAKAYREPVLEDEVLDAMETAGVEIPVEVGALANDEEWARGRLFFIGEGKDPYSVVCEDEAAEVVQRRNAAEGDYTEVDEATYWAMRSDLLIEALEAKAEAVVIPTSMEMSPDEAEAAAAAIKRHRVQTAPEEEVVPSAEDLPFQPDEAISL